MREAEGCVDGGRVVSGFDGRDELPAQAGARGELGLTQPGSEAPLPQRGGSTSCHDPGILPGFWQKDRSLANGRES